VSNHTDSIRITCHEVWNELANYTEEDVTSELRFRIEVHLMECDGCRAIYDGLVKVIRLVRGAYIIELPEGFSRRLGARLSSEL